MKKIKTLIVDDEHSAIQVLKGMLQEFCGDWVEVVATVSDEKEVIAALARYKPDLVFLDIEMSPLTNGIDLLGKIPQRNFGIVITTAYPNYAIRALNTLQPWGYLLKPVSVDELVLVVQKAQQIIRETVSEQPAAAPKETSEGYGIIVSDPKRGNIVVRFQDLYFCKAENAVVVLHYQQEGRLQKIITYKTLKELESTLPDVFYRIHNNTIVNMRYIARYEVIGRNGLVHLSNGQNLEVSVSKMADFQERFQLFVAQGN